MNEDYYHEQNPCYDSNSFGFDQFQPPQYTDYHQILNSQNEFFNSQNEQFNSGCEHLNTQMTTLHDLIAQAMQKKEEEKRIAEEQAAKERYWKIPICDDDDDNTIAITPVLSTEEPVNSLIMENEHLDTISATESDEFIKSSVEILVPIPSESKGVPSIPSLVPLSSMLSITLPIRAVSSKVMEIVIQNYEAFSNDHIEETSSGSTTTYSDSSFSKYDSFIFDLSINSYHPSNRSDFHEEFADELAQIISQPEYDCFFKDEPELGNFTMDVVGNIFQKREPRVHVLNVLPTLELDFIPSSESIFAYVEVDINKKTENQAKIDKLSMEWKDLMQKSRPKSNDTGQSQY
ncbi:hypothetical protein Tco_0391075 [Tanacetum coccineum]